MYRAATFARAVMGTLLIHPQTHVMQVYTNSPITHSSGNDVIINTKHCLLEGHTSVTLT